MMLLETCDTKRCIAMMAGDITFLVAVSAWLVVILK